MSTPEEREQMAAAIQQLNARLQQQETAVTILTQETESLARQVQGMTGTPGQRVRVGVVGTRVIGKPDQFDGDPMTYADWSFKLRTYLGVVDQRYQEELAKTEASPTPRLNATLDSEGSALSTQMYSILVMTTAGAALDKCHTACVNEGFEAWRQFVMEWERKLRTRCVCGTLCERVGVPIQRRHSKQAGCVRENRTRQREPAKTLNNDIQIGVTMLVMEDMRVKRQDHKLESDARRDSRDHENTTVHRQSTNANAARSESEEQGQGQRQQGQRQRRGRRGRMQGQGCKERIVQERKERRSENMLLL